MMTASLSEIQDFLTRTISVMVYVTIPFVFPCVMARKNIEEHYRQWVATGAYWHRAYDKWVVGDRVFYADEFWGDILGSVGIAVVLTIAALLLIPTEAVRRGEDLLVPTMLASCVIRLAFVLYERVRRMDLEVARRMESESGFSPAAELERLFQRKPNYVKRVLGKHKARFNADYTVDR